MCKQWTVVFSFVSAFSPSNVFAADHYTHFYYAPDAYIGINLSAMEIAEDGIEDAEVAAIYGRLGSSTTIICRQNFAWATVWATKFLSTPY